MGPKWDVKRTAGFPGCDSCILWAGSQARCTRVVRHAHLLDHGCGLGPEQVKGWLKGLPHSGVHLLTARSVAARSAG